MWSPAWLEHHGTTWGTDLGGAGSRWKAPWEGTGAGPSFTLPSLSVGLLPVHGFCMFCFFILLPAAHVPPRCLPAGSQSHITI